MYTRISTKVILGLGGIYARMVGIKATKAIIRAAIEAILSARLLSWKKIPKFIIPRSQRGRKIVATVTVGNLYSGIVKCAYWKCFTFYLPPPPCEIFLEGDPISAKSSYKIFFAFFGCFFYITYLSF